MARESSSFTDWLRDETWSLHEHLESLPYSKTILAGEARLLSYVGHIRAMAALHAILEKGLDGSTSEVVKAVWQEDMRKLPLLVMDLEFFRYKLLPDLPEAVAAVLKMVAAIRLKAVEEPLTLLGYLYVLEGSTQGAMILAPKVAESLGLDRHHGLAYLTNYGQDAPRFWEETKTRLNLAVIGQKEKNTILAAAKELYGALTEVFEALHPLDKEALRYSATSFNFEAGNHPVTQDPGEIAAVLRATDRCLAKYPYFTYRYGERGRRFTDSDGAWLAALLDLDERKMLDQILWLGRVLSSRGMPRFLLQRPLEIVHEEPTRAVPEKGNVCDN
ncbi:MAG: biliverdin-producing heme oxygenase, partial [Deltaproteobacteria bacterium]|nr:biliverdin-producing heme oxygenase [Deltaproteobacteria bacterium]